MVVAGSGVEELGGGFALAAGGEQRPDHFLTQDQQGADGPQTFRDGLVPAGLADPEDHSLGPELFDVIGGADLAGQFRCCEPGRRRRERQNGFGDTAHSGLIEINSAHFGLSDFCRLRQLLQRFVGDEATIDAAHRLSRIAFRRSTISPKQGSDRPQRYAFALCRMTSIRRTRSPLV